MKAKAAILSLTAVMFAIPLAGCASEPSTLEYFKGRRSCSGWTMTTTEIPFQAEFNGDRFSLKFDGQTESVFPAGTYDVRKEDGLVILEQGPNKIMLDIPESLPEDGDSISIPYGAVDSGFHEEVQYVVTPQGSSFLLSTVSNYTGDVLQDMGRCTKK